MRKNACKNIVNILSLSFCLLCAAVYGQQTPGTKFSNYATALNNIRELKPVEKLYLQTDKSHYTLGDTLRFKGYLLNADYLTPSLRSGLLYVELDNQQGKSVKRIMVPVVSGLAWGDMALDSAEVDDGTYTLRAYTNWMRNFGEDYIFKKQVTVSKTTGNPVLVNAAFKQVGNKVEAELLFSLLDGRIQAFKDVELKVMNGKRNLSKDKVVTGPDGAVKVIFALPEGDAGLSIQASASGSGVLSIPVNINRKENTDVQFLPEGGQLVAGIKGMVGFKAVGEDGKGVNIKGNIFDSKGNSVAAFASAHAGMGSFEFTPTGGQVYTAKVDGIAKGFTLPVVKESGTTLAVSSDHIDSLSVTLNRANNVTGLYYLIAYSRGVVCYTQIVSALPLKTSIDKNLFPSGIVRFSLFNAANHAVNERNVFVNHHDEVRIAIMPHQTSYGIRDSIALAIKVTDKNGAPVEGSFGLAVTDNDQVRQDSLGSNILTNLLLTSDLKGSIEDPGYYFTGDKATELDDLMLTQGWVGYDWEEAFNPKLPLAFKPEKEFTISGTVVNAFGKPIDKSNIVLLSNQPVVLKIRLQTATAALFLKIYSLLTPLFSNCRPVIRTIKSLMLA